MSRGQTLGIEFDAISDDQSAMFSVQIANLKEVSLNVDDIPESFFLDGLKTNRVKDMEISSLKITTIANQLSKHYSLKYSYNHLNQNVGYILDSYIFVFDNKVFHLICKEKNIEGALHTIVFNNLLNSFMLENFE